MYFRADRMMHEAAQMQQSREISEMRSKGKENRHMYDGIHDALDDDSGIALSPSKKLLSPKHSDGSPKKSSSARPLSKIPRKAHKESSSPSYTNISCVRTLNALDFGRTVTLPRYPKLNN